MRDVRAFLQSGQVHFLISSLDLMNVMSEIYPYFLCDRTMFYTSLGRLLMVDLGEDEEKFDSFMMPITQSFESLGQVFNSNSGYNTEEVRH